MKVVITTLIWKRENIFRVWCSSVKRLQGSFPGIEINVLVAGSEGKKSRELVEFFGFDYIETPNDPLGEKANIRLRSCKKYKADYILFLGSDDIMSNKTFSFILDKMQRGYDEIAPLDLYIYDTNTKTFIHSVGYVNHRKGERLAIGRAVKCSVLKKLNWELWPSSFNRGLDAYAKDMLDTEVNNPYFYRLKNEGLMTIDVKNSQNLSKFMVMKNHTRLPLNDLKGIEEYDQIILL